jgi:hypothetical protein
MVHIDKDGFAVASAQFGQHSLDKEKLNKIADSIKWLFTQEPESRTSDSVKIRRIINEGWPAELSRAEENFIITQVTK